MSDEDNVTTGYVRVNQRWMSPAARYYRWKPDRERVKALGLELYGVEFSRPIRMAIEKDIREQHRRARPEGRASLKKSIHSVDVEGVGRVRVIYHVDRHEVIDVLPPVS